MGWADEGGPCKFLTEDNLCAIYETRPDICHVSMAHELLSPSQTWDEYVSDSIAACNAMMDTDGVDQSLRIEAKS
jgi:Fe-S-cluster containining protein